MVPRACAELGISEAAVPPHFPVFLADALRAAGVALRVDADLFVARRRVKTAHELEGIRRAQATADAAMAVARDLIAECRPVEERARRDPRRCTTSAAATSTTRWSPPALRARRTT